MTRRKIIEKYIAPKYKEYSYSYVIESSATYTFYNNDKTICAEYEVTKDISNLCIKFYIKYGTRLSAISVNDLIRVDLPDTLRCRDEKEFRESAEYYADCAISIILPILERVNSWTVPIEYELYKELSKNPEERAKSFAGEHNLDFSASEKNCEWVQDWFLKQLPEDPVIRDYIFQENLDMFMGYIAYLGEVRCKLSNYCWGWLPSFRGRFSEPLEFGLVFHKDGEVLPAIDLLRIFIRHWNFYGILKNIPPIYDFWDVPQRNS